MNGDVKIGLVGPDPGTDVTDLYGVTGPDIMDHLIAGSATPRCWRSWPGHAAGSPSWRITVLGAIEVTTGRWVYRLGRRCAADFIALLQMLAEAFPRAPVIVVICDNDSIHHARAVTAYLKNSPAWSCSTAPGTARTTIRSSGSAGPG